MLASYNRCYCCVRLIFSTVYNRLYSGNRIFGYSDVSDLMMVTASFCNIIYVGDFSFLLIFYVFTGSQHPKFVTNKFRPQHASPTSM